MDMQVLYERCAGCDVHKKAVTVHMIVPGAEETRTYGTITGELLELVGWLEACQVTHVAMESTGVYWWTFALFEVIRAPAVASV